jgi:hypothetical protein
MKKSVPRRCKNDADCPPRYICNPVNGCVKRDRKSDTQAQIVRNQRKLSFKPKKRNIIKWPLAQGEEGFNQLAQRRMIDAGIDKKLEISCDRSRNPMMPYQVTSAFLLRPSVPISRFLLNWRAGGGKTRGMISILDNYWADPRAKIILVPSVELERNFVGEVLKFPSRYRDYVVSKLGPQVLQDVMNPRKVKQVLSEVTDLLAMKGRLRQAGEPGELAAPIRAMRYTIAGGSTALPKPTNPILKYGYDGDNPYSNTLVIADEVHSLVVPTPETEKYFAKVEALGKALYRAKNNVFVGMTATPFIDDPGQGGLLMHIIKGEENLQKNNEGFVSYFQSLPRAMFPIVRRGGSKIGIKMAFKVEGTVFKGKVKENLGAYRDALRKADLLTMTELPKDEKKILKLMNMINLSSTYSHIAQAKWVDKYASQPRIYGTKIHALVESILSTPGKSLVLVNRRFGFKAFVQAFNLAQQGKAWPCATPACFCNMYDKKDLDCLTEFNSEANKRGDLVRTMIIDTTNFSVGTSFFGVRNIYFLNPPFEGFGMYQQRLGRALRACSYDNLPQPEREVTVRICVGETGSLPSIDEIAFTKLQAEAIEYEGNMRFYHDIAVDAPFIDKFI